MIEALCIKESKEWPKINAGQIYKAYPQGIFLIIQGYKIENKRFLEHFKTI